MDTCVVVAGLRSKEGASHEILRRLGREEFETAVSVSLVLEYEEVLLRQSKVLGLTHEDVSDLIDYLCSVSVQQQMFFLWRPQLPDPDDDAVLELAANARCEVIITHNVRDFVGSEGFGVQVMTPGDFLNLLRGEI